MVCTINGSVSKLAIGPTDNISPSDSRDPASIFIIVCLKVTVSGLCCFVLSGETDINPFPLRRRPLLAILSLGWTGEPYSCTLYTDILLEVLVSRCFV